MTSSPRAPNSFRFIDNSDTFVLIVICQLNYRRNNIRRSPYHYYASLCFYYTITVYLLYIVCYKRNLFLVQGIVCILIPSLFA